MKGEEALIYLFLIVAVVFIVIGFFLTVGVFILGGIAAWGALVGVISGLQNFFIVVEEAHTKKAGLPRVWMMEQVEKVQLPQPAQLMYPFGAGWQVMKYVNDNLFIRTDPEAKKYFRDAEDWKLKAQVSSGAWGKYFNYCIFGGFWLAALMRYLAAYLIVAIFFVLQITFLVVWMMAAAAAMAVLAAYNYLYSLVFRIFFRCPDCHEEMVIPVYICSNCSREHSRLWPSVYGVFRHTCQCGYSLPVLDMIGRKDLVRKCAICSTPINNAVGTKTNIHIPVIGGPNCGKSNFIFQATRQFITEYAPPRKIKVAFPEPKHQESYDANTRLLSTGQVILKTTEIIPQAYNLTVKRRRDFLGKIIYLYDAAGEAYANSENLAMQKTYYNYIHGLILIIDPFSIEYFARLHADEIEKIKESVQPCPVGIMDAYSRMMVLLESSFGVKKGEKFKHPLAIVVSKTDALDLDQLIGQPAAQELIRNDPSFIYESDACNMLVEKFLEENQMGNLLRSVHSHFTNVRFFSCSSLGRLPDKTHRPFHPLGVMDPLLWILSEVGVINTSKERSQEMDRYARAHAGTKGNLFRMLRYYLWDSLRPQRKG